VNHGVASYVIVEILLLRRRRQLAIGQEVAGLQEITVFGELLDRVAVIEQDAILASI